MGDKNFWWKRIKAKDALPRIINASEFTATAMQEPPRLWATKIRASCTIITRPWF